MNRNSVIYQQVNMQGQAAMKAALMINGGASVAMLAFIGTAMNNIANNSLLSKLCCSLLMFIFGVLSAAVAFGVTYLAGFAFIRENTEGQSDKNIFKRWKTWNNIAIWLVVIGYVLFLIGSLNAYFAFKNSLH